MRRISTRLAVAFLIVALLPAVPLSLVVHNLLERRFGPAIAEPLEQALEAGLAESREHLREQKTLLQRRAEDLITDLTADRAGEHAGDRTGADMWAPRIGINGAWPRVSLLNAAGEAQPAAAARSFWTGQADLLRSVPRPAATVAGVPAGVPAVAVPLRVGETLLTTAILAPDTLLVAQPLPPGMVERAGDMSEGLGLLRTVRRERARVLLSFLAPFLVIYGVLIVVALGLGALWARRMVRPLEALVAGTRRVGAGDLETQVGVEAPGEVGDLVRAFDTMVGSLADQRRDLARLERAAAWRGMARTLAHEIKNPLTPILLAVQEARDAYRGDDAEYRALLDECEEIVREEVDSLRNLVHDFGDFARLPRPELRPGDLMDLVRDVAQLYGDERLLVEAGDQKLACNFDASALRRALINLIDNGLAACREAGGPGHSGQSERVILAVARRANEIHLTVTDQGAGIPAANLAQIFKPDFTTKDEGLGLGLAIVDSIVAGHGGRIDVTSEEGTGTSLTLRLPLASAYVEPNDQEGTVS